MSSSRPTILLLFALIALPLALTARHLIGGEMSYKCLGNGDYEITLQVYRDCLTDGANFDRDANFAIFQCDGTIDCTELEQGSQGFTFTVPLDTVETLNFPDPTCELPQICVEQGTYRFRLSDFDAFLPTTNNSYHIVHQRCCRNGSITNIENPEEFGSTFTIAITPAAQQACNSSPTFDNFPPVLTCINELFEFQQTATDEEGDSLVYAFSAPLHGGGNDVTRDNFESCVGAIPNPPCPPPYASVPFIQPIYDAQFPFGDFDETIDLKSTTGLITGTPTLIGQFVAGISIQEYRNGILLSTSQREVQINVINCNDTNDRIGSACDDGNPNTENDRIIEDCSCQGVLTETAKNKKDLFISEYFESTTASKCIEIYNPSDQDIVFNDQYVFKIYNEEHPTGIIIHRLAGTIPSHSTYVICHQDSETNLINDANATFDIDFDGNDAITLEREETLIDIFGNRACFPEDFWTGTTPGISSRNKTLVRCPCLQNGNTEDPLDCSFPALSEEWICLPRDDASNLGKHDTLAEEGTFFNTLTDIYCDCAQTCRERDSLILVELHKTTGGENWVNKWDLSEPIDTWFGIALNDEGCVSCIDLDGIADCGVPYTTDTIGNNLVGFIPDQIGELESLNALYLSHNHLTGVIPRSIGNLTQLQKLWLNNNRLSGDFPTGLILLDDLQQVVVDSNQLTGVLPPEMADLAQLNIFTARHNQLTSCFPDSYIDLCPINVSFSENPALPWGGEFEIFCDGNSPQLGASCDDQEEETLLDVIQSDCTCKGKRDIQPLLFSTPCRVFKMEEESCLPFQVTNFKSLRGIQLSMSWDVSVLEFTQLQIGTNLSSLSANSFNQEQIEEGQLQLFWADENSILGNDLSDEDTLFKLCFIRQTLDTAIITINDDSKVPFPSMAFTTELESVPIIGNICNPTHDACRNINILGTLEDPEIIEVCGSTVSLSADSPPDAHTGRWINSNPFITLDNPSDTEIIINQLPRGSTFFSYVLDTVDCTSYIPESFEVVQLFRPVLQRDTFIITDKEAPFAFSITSDEYNTDLASRVLESPTHGDLDELAIGQFEFLPANSLTTQDEFIYEICYENCPAICGATTIVFQFQRPIVEVPSIDENLIPNTITPNGDGLNDQLVFPQLLDPLAFPDNELLVFNRWGDEVFISKSYDNTWSGTDGNGNALTEGTYYYILRLDVGRGNVLRGEIVILR